MCKIDLVVSTILVAFLAIISGAYGDVGEPLFLTPYIRNDQISQGRQLALVRNLTTEIFEPVSYSGFITVNDTHNSNIFFWFFPAQIILPDAPVILWCEGGPGQSGMYPLFNGNGPYRIDEYLKLNWRKYTWNMENSVIFIDNPIGAGFSFTENEEGYLRSSHDASHLYEFIQQFFTLFPEFLIKDFYAGGHSFGAGKYAPIIAKEIHDRNRNNDGLRINLKGLILEAPYADPQNQLNFGNSLYSVGILDSKDRDYVQIQTALAKEYIQNGNYLEAYLIVLNVLAAPDSYILNRTGLEPEFIANYLGTGFVREDGGLESYFEFYLEQEAVRKGIHVGNLTFQANNPLTRLYYDDKGLLSSTEIFETLLNATEGYKVLIYCGQLDVITDHLGMKQFVNDLKWVGAEEYKNARSNPFISVVGDKVNGFVRQARNLSYLLFRNAGHDVTGDQRSAVWDAVSRFIKNIPLN